MKIRLTTHAKERIEKRKITEDEIINTIKFPEKLNKKHGRYYAQKDIGRGKIEVVYEKIENIEEIEKGKYLNIITIYWI